MLKTRLRIALLAVMVFILLLFIAAIVFAAGLPHTPGNTIIQNLKGIAPVKGQSGCVTTAATKGAIQGQYSSMKGYTGYAGDVFAIYSSQATQEAKPVPVPVKWKLDGAQTAVGSTFDFTNNEGNAYSRVTQELYSSGKKKTYSSCSRRQ